MTLVEKVKRTFPAPEKAPVGKVLKDPVCGMDVDKDSPHHTEQGGEKIYLCSDICLKKFKENPSAYRTEHEHPAMMRWRANLFIFMSRNAADATSFFTLPAEQTIEVGVRLEI